MSQENSQAKDVPMLEHVSIKNFKGIRSCEINDISKVNLFVGKNGCGKSSIMEAIYFTGKEFLGSMLRESIRRRANRVIVSARELWYGYDINLNIENTLDFNDGSNVSMNLEFAPDRNVFDVDFSYYDGIIEARNERVGDYSIGNCEVRTRGRSSFHDEFSRQLKQSLDDSVYLDPTIKVDVVQLEHKYLNLLKLSEERSSDLAKRTSTIYETKPSWEFLPHQDFPPDSPSRFSILEGEKRLFFDNFGDGLHYGVAILSVAQTRKNTALFIEEIESHQHPDAIRNLVSNLLDIVRTNNLQLFITTHSPIALRYLYHHYKTPEDRKKEFRCFHITRNKESGEVQAIQEEGLFNIQEDLHGKPK